MKKILASFLLLAACASKAPVSDDFTDLAGSDEKSDAFSYRMKLLGTLDYGASTSATPYSKSPRYRAYKFNGYEGDRVDFWVRSTNGGDAVAWLLDGSFNVLGQKMPSRGCSMAASTSSARTTMRTTTRSTRTS